jgi:hypothetical protein
MEGETKERGKKNRKDEEGTALQDSHNDKN